MLINNANWLSDNPADTLNRYLKHPRNVHSCFGKLSLISTMRLA
jgi:hypothetical protein